MPCLTASYVHTWPASLTPLSVTYLLLLDELNELTQHTLAHLCINLVWHRHSVQ